MKESRKKELPVQESAAEPMITIEPEPKSVGHKKVCAKKRSKKIAQAQKKVEAAERLLAKARRDAEKIVFRAQKRVVKAKELVEKYSVPEAVNPPQDADKQESAPAAAV